MSKVLFSQRFKQARMVAGLKAREVAAAMNVSQGYVSQIESGKRENVSKDLLLLAANKMCVGVEWLLTGKDPPTEAHATKALVESARHDPDKMLAMAVEATHDKIAGLQRTVELQAALIESYKDQITTLKANLAEANMTVQATRKVRG